VITVFSTSKRHWRPYERFPAWTIKLVDYTGDGAIFAVGPPTGLSAGPVLVIEASSQTAAEALCDPILRALKSGKSELALSLAIEIADEIEGIDGVEWRREKLNNIRQYTY
jgi:hypothetical protein